MSIKTRLLACTTSVVFACGLAVAAAPAAHAAAPAPLDPTQWSVACDSLVGTIKFATAISLAPSTTDNTITVKAMTSGCTVPDTSVPNGTAPGVNGGGAATGDPFTCVAPGVKHAMTVGDGHTTSASTAISSASSPFLGSDVGQFVTGIGIPANTLITAVGPLTPPITGTATTATLSQAATATATTIKFTMGLGTPNQPCVNLAPAKLGGVLTSLAGHNNFYNTASDGHTTSGSALISCATCSLNNLETGSTITGAGIPLGATITVTSPTTATLSANATATSLTVHFAHADASGCLGLSGLSTGTSGSNVTQFKNGSKGLDNATALPKLLDPTDANVTSTINSTLGTTFTAPWGGTYGEFQIGTSFGTDPAARTTGAFRGGDNGAGDLFDGTTGESSGAILIQCLGKGLKALSFGVGHVTFS